MWLNLEAASSCGSFGREVGGTMHERTGRAAPDKETGQALRYWT